MKTIGLIGGTGWVSTVEYYKLINEKINEKLGGLNFAKVILYSFNYGEIDALNRRSNKSEIYKLLEDASKKIITAGAECILLCANTLHQYAEELEKNINAPLIHIAEATAGEIKKMGFTKVGLLGTKQTMEMDFYKSKLAQQGIETVVPELNDRNFIQSKISNELIKNVFLDKSRERFIEIINKLAVQGAQGIILGCTEIPLLVKPEHTLIPLLNTLEIHSRAAVEFSI